MQKIDDLFRFSASDLVGYLNCRHLSNLDRSVAEGALAKPQNWDPLLEILRQRGLAHEQKYIEHLAGNGLQAVTVPGSDVSPGAVNQTLAAMESGAPLIVQGALAHGCWVGRADVLLRVETPSILGSWSYEPVDTKLARETKAGSILQLCLYADLLREMQGAAPEFMHIVRPWSDFQPQTYRFADYAAYFRKVQRGLASSIAAGTHEATYPDPQEHCEICRWERTCEQRRRNDDHLCLVAGISKMQIAELGDRGIKTLEALAATPVPLQWKPERGSAQALTRIREQARIQDEARKIGEHRFELLPVEPGFGLCLLPAPSPGDVFLDLEGDPFVGEHGLEYLFGFGFTNGDGNFAYRGDWAFTRADEKLAFENFVNFVMDRWSRHPDLHVYHYAPYEPAALKRLMGRYATREDEIDRMLRAGVFVDLYGIVRNGLRASVESYSIKRLEPFYEFERSVPLSAANSALSEMSASLELEDAPSVTEECKGVVLGYNRDDCLSAAKLRDWLEARRAELVASGTAIPRPVPGDGAPDEKISDWMARIAPLTEALSADVPADPAERNAEQQARWILANILDWHRREQKAVWWDYFRLAALSADDLLDEKAGLSGLAFLGAVSGTARAPIHRYSFPPQETEFRGGEDLKNLGGDDLGKVAAISFEDFTVDIKKRQDSIDIHPKAVFEHGTVRIDVLAEALARIAEVVVANGISGNGQYKAARALLLKEPPFPGGDAMRREGETALDAALRVSGDLPAGIFPIQGPPGAGKTYTGARMICELVRGGKKVGITANSHKVIRNLIDAVIEAADELGVDLHCCQRAAEMEDAQHRLSFAKKPEDLLDAFGNGTDIGGGTAWLWARHDAFELIDVLFVDEAAQMSLANVLAVSHAARTVVLLGDPQQLDQPTQGSHPEGTGISTLSHILGESQIISPDKGLFLDETWRLHPDICAFTSEAFYAGKLRSREGRENQIIRSSGGPVSGSGLRYLAVEHVGNQNCSPEEAIAVADLVNRMLDSNTTWTDDKGCEKALGLGDVLIIAPYNAQVFEIRKRLPGARVGTVDKFQGQQAAVAIYSTTTSSYSDAPRGMEFLYSLNRLNVATSRAKCISVLVSSSEIFEAECRSPRQMQLANAFCRYLEVAEPLAIE